MNDKVDTAPKDYIIQFKRAVLTFLHQRVYDLDSEKLVHLNPLTNAVDIYLKQLNKYLSRGMVRIQDGSGRTPSVYDTTLDFLGKSVDDDMAKNIAEGNMDAKSLTLRNKMDVDLNFKTKKKRNIYKCIQQTKEKNVCFPHSYMCSRDNTLLFCTTCGNYLILKH